MANMSDRLPVCDGQDLEAGLELVMAWVLSHDGVPKITDRAVAFAVNMEFDRIRDALMRQRKAWEQYEPLYWRKKYLSYQAVLPALDETLREEFCFRMRQEFKRAMQLGQLRKPEFTAAQWRDIRHMTDEALGYVGLRGALREISPYIPAFIKRGIVGVIRLAAKSK